MIFAGGAAAAGGGAAAGRTDGAVTTTSGGGATGAASTVGALGAGAAACGDAGGGTTGGATTGCFTIGGAAAGSVAAAGFAATTGGAGGAAGRGGMAVVGRAGGSGTRTGGCAGAGCGCVLPWIAFSTSPGLEIWERSNFGLISSAPARLARASLPGPAASRCALKCCRTFSASSASMELEWVFFSATPREGRSSRISLLLTSNSLARSLIRTFGCIRPVFSEFPLSLHRSLTVFRVDRNHCFTRPDGPHDQNPRYFSAAESSAGGSSDSAGS